MSTNSLALPAGIVGALMTVLLALTPQTGAASDILSARQIMEATGLDRVFDTYGRDISFSVRQQPVAPPEPFIDAWEETAAKVYDAEDMHSALETALTGVFSEAEQGALRDFYLSDFGRRIVGLEAAAMGLEPERQLIIEREGAELWEGLEPGRQEVLERIQSLAGGEMIPIMLRETMRALYLGMALNSPNRPGSLDSSEIDALVDQMLPGLVTEVEAATRSLSAVIYQDLDDSELEAYAAFLETPEARRFYSTLVVAMTGVTVDATEAFGRQLARRLTQQGA